MYYYFVWYTFLRNRRYQEISSVFVLETLCEEFTIKVDKNQQNLHFALHQSQSASAGLESEIEQLVSEMGLEGSQSGNAKQG